MLSFHFGLEDQACKIREDQSCGDSHRAGGKASHKESDQSVFVNGFFHSFPQDIAKTKQGSGYDVDTEIFSGGKIHGLF